MRKVVAGLVARSRGIAAIRATFAATSVPRSRPTRLVFPTASAWAQRTRVAPPEIAGGAAGARELHAGYR